MRSRYVCVGWKEEGRRGRDVRRRREEGKRERERSKGGKRERERA